MAFAMPLVVPKSKTVTLGGQSFNQVTLGVDISAQSAADVHSILTGIAYEETALQERLSNPPQVVEVDNRTNKPVDDVQAKIVVVYGVQLARTAMRVVEDELRRAIANTTTRRSGRLQNISANWEWRLIQGGRTTVVSSANPPMQFGRGDRLVLVPTNVNYASVVNRAVANSGRSNAHITGNIRGDKAKIKLAKSAQNLGFLAATTWVAKRRAEFTQFAIYAEFTKAHAVPGELYRHGTGVITIRPRYRQLRGI